MAAIMTKPLFQNCARVMVTATVAAMFLSLAAAAGGQDNEAAAPSPVELSEAGADTCLGCHNADSMLVIFRTPHGQQTDPGSPMAQLQCESCHGPGGEHAGRQSPAALHHPVVTFGAGSATSTEDQNSVCMDCHADDISLAWAGSMHERNDTSCASCHSVHTSSDPVGLQSAQAEVCFDCHRQQRAESLKPSAHPLSNDLQLRPATMICTDCHNPHASVAPGLIKTNTLNELCTGCHAEFRGPVLFDHAPVSEDCSLCHQPHGSVHAPLLTRQAPLLCQSCHSQRGHPSISFTDAGLPGGNPSPMVLGRSCMNCHTQVHGSNHPSGYKLMR